MNDNESKTRPCRISDREVPIVITGHFMPTSAPGVPVLVGMPGTEGLFVLVFSPEEKLRVTMEAFDSAYERIAIVTDGGKLLEDVVQTNVSGGRPYRIQIALDSYRLDNGSVRYLEPLAEAQIRVHVKAPTEEIP